LRNALASTGGLPIWIGPAEAAAMALAIEAAEIRRPFTAKLGAVDVVCTLLLISFLLTGHHHLVLRLLAVLAWAVIVPGMPAAAKWQRRQHS
jgi:hypothetical protein